jgi:hypothetical protein
LRAIFALLDPDRESGSRDPIESGSDRDPDPQHFKEPDNYKKDYEHKRLKTFRSGKPSFKIFESDRILGGKKIQGFGLAALKCY